MVYVSMHLELNYKTRGIKHFYFTLNAGEKKKRSKKSWFTR